MRKKTIRLAAAAAVLGLGTAGAVTGAASANIFGYKATLKDPSGNVVGYVTFRSDNGAVKVDADLKKNPYVKPGAFHGFHVHANNDPSNGSGCQADAKQPSSTWFQSADGHLLEPGQTHGMHDGDMPSPLVLDNGSAELTFTTDSFSLSDLKGRAVMLHAQADNFGNIPVGSGPTQYTPNSPAATDLTARTGNSGDRVACGLVEWTLLF